ncbi:hypothetical protein A3A79_05190 [Candidatus Gottesmanbacteria bacterium RIFCSPLOWO2_01_FULL_43_11b]|uniref:Uncharacterized protein n=1 Tax=Candidatus Gottesmanbacteria bacterium RIFCSPLOWO2_01_FULL_43_11b TaxID=1798392 RepID=A0A1F6AIJ4_9BACT|nr:MAG: hypothetical protein A3A79_05190 [Candidatus Gottesmanbacteria bacterium RIFCSPLOWO2_01_FULL_43_11b]
MKREFDPTQQTFFKSPRPHTGLLSRVRSYHPGVYNMEGHPPLKILVLGAAEVKYLKEKVGTIPVTEITDPNTQVWFKNRRDEGTTTLSEKPIGFVQDTEGARMDLKKGKFKEKKPELSLVPDKNFNY